MEYVVLKDYLLPEHAKWYETKEELNDPEPEQIQLYVEDTFEDGYIEPDIVSRLWSSGVIEPVNMKAEKARLTRQGRLNVKSKPKDK